jgi:hypothetical protein
MPVRTEAKFRLGDSQLNGVTPGNLEDCQTLVEKQRMRIRDLEAEAERMRKKVERGRKATKNLPNR